MSSHVTIIEDMIDVWSYFSFTPSSKKEGCYVHTASSSDDKISSMKSLNHPHFLFLYEAYFYKSGNLVSFHKHPNCSASVFEGGISTVVSQQLGCDLRF